MIINIDECETLADISKRTGLSPEKISSRYDFPKPKFTFNGFSYYEKGYDPTGKTSKKTYNATGETMIKEKKISSKKKVLPSNSKEYTVSLEEAVSKLPEYGQRMLDLYRKGLHPLDDYGDKLYLKFYYKGFKCLEDFTIYTKDEIADLDGIGKGTMAILEETLKENNLSFAE